jgi:ATP-dependent Clp protease ATP-binding subunit ClpC
MFERYREDARRAIFFARWEAQQSGSAYIEPAHLLLSLTHDAAKANQLFGLAAHAESFRQQLASHASAQSSTSVDLPLSNTGKRVLAYTVEEADKLASRPIGTEHVLLGLLREKNQACRQRSGRRESISTLQEIGSEKIAGYQSLTASQLILTASQLIKRLPSDHCGHSRVSRFWS